KLPRLTISSTAPGCCGSIMCSVVSAVETIARSGSFENGYVFGYSVGNFGFDVNTLPGNSNLFNQEINHALFLFKIKSVESISGLGGKLFVPLQFLRRQVVPRKFLYKLLAAARELLPALPYFP